MSHEGKQARPTPGHGQPRAPAAVVGNRGVASESQPGTRDATSCPPPPMPTILVAEDDEGMRDFVTEVLRNGGFRVLTARDGAEGIELAEQGDLQIDCVLTDQVMPGASGCELAQRARLRWTKVPVLVISGYRIDEDHFSRQLGSRIAFLRKPFTPRELLAHIGSLLA